MENPHGTPEAEFELWQNDMMEASASGPRARAWSEIMHYAHVYGQDGPIEIFEIKRVKVYSMTLPTQEPQS